MYPKYYQNYDYIKWKKEIFLFSMKKTPKNQQLNLSLNHSNLIK